MKALKIIKSILFALVYSTNLLFALCLWSCGQRGDIFLGIIFIVLYRLSLWFSPVLITVLCWLPTRPKRPLYQKLIFNLVHLTLCAGLFGLCFLLFGNWY